MAIYKVRDLQNTLSEIAEDGYPLVEFSESEADEDFPASISFDAVTPFEIIEYEPVESYSSPIDELPSVETFSLKDRCFDLNFSYEEIYTIHHAVKNALEYFKECEKDPQYSRDTKQQIKKSSVACRNLDAKLTKFLNHFSAK